MADVKEFVINILVEQLGLEENEVTNDSTLGELGADDLDYVDIVSGIDEEFEITLSEEISEKPLLEN
ncbi:MAG TPA: phosphopantetheine-binding protein [Flavisolibacter sp.]|nr:phosphopantetheine-binding protein [Flavisolibacter sp.]